jgi:hypothetical protein
VGRGFLAFLSLSLLALWMPACAPSPSLSSGMATAALPTRDLVSQAAAEATAIVQRAQATALVLQAQAQATALAQQAQTPEPTAAPQVLPVLPSPTPAAGDADEIAAALTVTETGQAAGEATVVELLGVGFAAEGAFVIVNYRAPPQAAQTFWPGVLSVTDEASGTVFNEVPLMPLIGPLIARPVEAGQVGYVMLVHAPPILRDGSRVTVVLGDYTFEHVPVE